MRSGDVRRVWFLVALAASCERHPSRRVVPPGSPGNPDEPAAGLTVAPASQGTPVPGCAAGWWPLADGQRWRWSIERRWEDEDGAKRGAREVVVEVRGGGGRFTLSAWPAPWSEAMARPMVIEVTGTRLDADGQRWLDLGRDARLEGVDRRVVAGDGARPAELELVWPSMADDVTVRLACGVGPVLFEYHHHGTLEELRAVRVGR